MYALNLAEDNRILSVTYDEYAPQEQPRVDNLPDGDVSDYKYLDGEYKYEPLPKEDVQEQSMVDIEHLEAQVMWTAVNTDTLLEDESEV